MREVVFRQPTNEKEWRQFRNKVQKMVNRANSMLDKLERNNLENTPSYRTFTDSEGRSRFGIKGMTNEQVNAEFQRVKNFLDNETSTVKGAKNYINQMSKITGMDVEQAKNNIDTFWKIADEVRKGLQAAKHSYLALDSERVIDAVQSVIQEHESGANSIQTMGDALQSAFEHLQEELPLNIDTSTAAYLDEYADKMKVAGNTIYIDL